MPVSDNALVQGKLGIPETVSEVDLRRAGQIVKVVDALARGRTIGQACKEAGIGATTWTRWKREGYVSEYLGAKFEDITSGVGGIVSNAMIESTRVLASLAKGQIPRDTSINGVLAPRDVIAAQAQLFNLWKQLSGENDTAEREHDRVLEELRERAINISLVHVNTINVGDETMTIPVPVIGRRETDIIEGEATSLPRS
jgi:hypothetical protein